MTLNKNKADKLVRQVSRPSSLHDEELKRLKIGYMN
jgi:hypothetical protein